MAAVTGERYLPTPTRQSARESAKRVSELYATFGPHNEDAEDEDFTPQRKRSRFNQGSESPTQQSSMQDSLERYTSETVMNESLEPNTLENPAEEFIPIEDTEDSPPEIEDRPAVESPTTKSKKPATRGRRVKKTATQPLRKPTNKTASRPSRGRATARDQQEQPPRANSSQVLSHRTKPSGPSTPPSHGTGDSVAGSVQPTHQTPGSRARADPQSVRVEIPSARSEIPSAQLRSQVEYLKKKVAILESSSTSKQSELLDAENEYMQQKINLTKRAYPDLQGLKKLELMELKNAYFKGVLDLYPRID